MKWNRNMVEGIGAADLERLLDHKAEQIGRLKDVVSEMEAEYDHIVDLAAQSEYHPRAKLRQGIREANRTLFSRPSMMERSRVAAPVEDAE